MINKFKQHCEDNNVNDVEQMKEYIQQKIDIINKTRGTNYTLADLLGSIDMDPETFYKELSKLFNNK